MVVAFKDIEEQRAAEQALREREAILAKVGQPVWVTDQAGFFHYANPAALAALGYDEPSDLVGHPAHDLVHYKYPDGSPFPEDDCPLVRPAGGETLRTPTTGSCARTARSCASPTRRRRSSCPTASVR